MKMRQRRKQFWWTWRSEQTFNRTYGWFNWGVGRVKHQIKGD